jgi:hypothetical protein
METAKIQEPFSFEDEMVNFNNFLHPSITFINRKTTRQPLATCIRNVMKIRLFKGQWQRNFLLAISIRLDNLTMKILSFPSRTF